MVTAGFSPAGQTFSCISRNIGAFVSPTFPRAQSVFTINSTRSCWRLRVMWAQETQANEPTWEWIPKSDLQRFEPADVTNSLLKSSSLRPTLSSPHFISVAPLLAERLLLAVGDVGLKDEPLTNPSPRLESTEPREPLEELLGVFPACDRGRSPHCAPRTAIA